MHILRGLGTSIQTLSSLYRLQELDIDRRYSKFSSLKCGTEFKKNSCDSLRCEMDAEVLCESTPQYYKVS